MMEQLTLIVDSRSEGALLRVLGTVERRGWQVREIEMGARGNAGAEIRLTVERRLWHRGDIGVLARHLEKLVPVECVHTAANAAERTFGPSCAIAVGA